MAFHALAALSRRTHGSGAGGVRRAGARGVLGAALVCVASIGPGCGVPALTVGGDAGSLESDAGDSGIGLEPLDGGTCQPGDVRAFVPGAYKPATPPWQDACTADEVAAFYTACIDPAATTTSCQAFSQLDAGHTACAACIVTPESAASYGPLINHGTFITENVGGCIELTDPSGLPCAKNQQALAGCELAACEANCPVTAVATSQEGLDSCTTSAAMAGCQMFASQASCALGVAEAGAATACVSQTFHDFYDAVVPLFCGPPPPLEGGAPPPDGRAVEDAAAGDAAVDGASDGPSGEASTPDGSSADAAITDAPAGDAGPDALPE